MFVYTWVKADDSRLISRNHGNHNGTGQPTLRDGLDLSFVVVGSGQNYIDSFTRHLLEERSHVSRSRRDSRFGFDKVRTTHAEPILQICPVLVVTNDVPASEGFRHAQPTTQLGDERTALEILTFQEGMKGSLER